MSYLKKEFGQNLRILRKSRGLTQEKLAEMIDLNQRQLVRIENGKSFVSSDVLERLVIALNVDIKELFDFKLKTVMLGKSGTDDSPLYKIVQKNNVIHLQKFSQKDSVTKIEENVVEDFPDKYLFDVAKKLNVPITAQHIKNGVVERTYIYNPDGTTKLIQNNFSDTATDDIEKIITKLKKIANSKNKINYVNLAIDSLTTKKALDELKMLIKGIELTYNDK